MSQDLKDAGRQSAGKVMAGSVLWAEGLHVKHVKRPWGGLEAGAHRTQRNRMLGGQGTGSCKKGPFETQSGLCFWKIAWLPSEEWTGRWGSVGT